jgi:hypothetical protein
MPRATVSAPSSPPEAEGIAAGLPLEERNLVEVFRDVVEARIEEVPAVSEADVDDVIDVPPAVVDTTAELLGRATARRPRARARTPGSETPARAKRRPAAPRKPAAPRRSTRPKRAQAAAKDEPNE